MRIWVSVALACWGCAGAKATPSPRPPSANRVGTVAVTQERHPYAELMRPAAPEALASPGLALSIKNPIELLHKLPGSKPTNGATASPGPSPVDVLSLVALAIGANAAAVVDLERPVELAVSLSAGLAPGLPEPPKFAVAFNVRSNEALERGEAGLLLRRLDAGLWQIGADVADVDPSAAEDEYEGDGEGEDESESDDMGPVQQEARPCLLAHSSVGFRVLCGLRSDDVQRVAPFLMRDVATSASADVHLELGGPAYRDVLARGLAAARRDEDEGGSEQGERLGRELGMAAVETLAAHQSLVVDGAFEGEGAKLELLAVFPTNDVTWGLAEWTRDHRGRPLPGSFGLLPGDGQWSGSFVGLGSELGPRLIKRFLDLVTEEMAGEYVLSPRESEELVGAFAGLLPADAHLSVAVGSDPASIERVLNSDAVVGADETERPLPPTAIKALQAALGGWATWAFDVSPATYLPAVERALRANAIPKRRRPGVPVKPTEREYSRTKRGPVTIPGLPAGTLHIVSETRPLKTYRPPADGSRPPILPYEQHWLIVPDGQRVWAVLARSEAIAGQRALAALRGKTRLAEQADVQRLAGRPLLAACSFTLLGTRLEGLEWDSATQRDLARNNLRRWREMPGADEPLLLTLESAPEQTPDAFGLRLVLHVGQGTLAQLVSSATRGLPRTD